MTSEQNGMQNVRCQSFSAWLRDHVYVATLIVLIASLVPRLFLTLSADPHELKTPDTGTYFAPAVNLLKHGAFLNGKQEPEVARTPGYPLFLLAIMVATGKNLDGGDLRTVVVVQTVIISWSVVLLYWLARRILPPIMAFTGALMAAFSPWGAARAGYLMTEGFYLLLLILLFYVMYLVVEHATRSPVILFGGVCIGLLTSAVVLVRPLWPLVPIVAVALFLLGRDKGLKIWILVAVMLVSASTPLYLWKVRNLKEAQFNGISMTAGATAHRYFASGIRARLEGVGGDRWAAVRATNKEESSWDLPSQAKNDERWRRVRALVEQHPFLSLFSYASNVGEAILHPDPAILKAAGLNFSGDFLTLGVIWAAYLCFALIGVGCLQYKDWHTGVIRRDWLLAFLGICLLLTVTSGLSFGGGSRFRAPLDLIVPLLVGVGLLRVVTYIKRENDHVSSL